jgi:hypothetical protein
MPKKQHFEKKSRVGPCNPPSGSLCLTFREMAKSSYEQSARVTILNSNRPKPKQIAVWIIKKSLLRNPHKEHQVEIETQILYADRLWRILKTQV